jgi:hypothetical protein
LPKKVRLRESTGKYSSSPLTVSVVLVLRRQGGWRRTSVYFDNLNQGACGCGKYITSEARVHLICAVWVCVGYWHYRQQINKRDKEQERILMITDHGLYVAFTTICTLPVEIETCACHLVPPNRYNILPDNLSKCQRRIDLALVTGVTMSATSDEFVVHVPDEYDYRFKTVCFCLPPSFLFVCWFLL